MIIITNEIPTFSFGDSVGQLGKGGVFGIH
jgi:hypothetical protein